MPHFGQDILYLSSESRNIFRYWFSKWKLKNSYRDTLDILEQNKLDAFIGLTRGPAWLIIGQILPPSKKPFNLEMEDMLHIQDAS